MENSTDDSIVSGAASARRSNPSAPANSTGELTVRRSLLLAANCSILHVLISLRAEGTPRLALELLREEKKQTGSVGQVAFLHPELRDLEPRFNELNVPLHELPWKRRRFDRLFFQTLRLLKRIKPQGI